MNTALHGRSNEPATDREPVIAKARDLDLHGRHREAVERRIQLECALLREHASALVAHDAASFAWREAREKAIKRVDVYRRRLERKLDASRRRRPAGALSADGGNPAWGDVELEAAVRAKAAGFMREVGFDLDRPPRKPKRPYTPVLVIAMAVDVSFDGDPHAPSPLVSAAMEWPTISNWDSERATLAMERRSAARASDQALFACFKVVETMVKQSPDASAAAHSREERNANGFVEKPLDEAAYIAFADLMKLDEVVDRFSEKTLRTFLEGNRGTIRQWKPQPQRLSIHRGDFAAAARVAFGDGWAPPEEAAARKADLDAKKRRWQ